MRLRDPTEWKVAIIIFCRVAIKVILGLPEPWIRQEGEGGGGV